MPGFMVSAGVFVDSIMARPPRRATRVHPSHNQSASDTFQEASLPEWLENVAYSHLPRSLRPVGRAMHSPPEPEIVPWHHLHGIDQQSNRPPLKPLPKPHEEQSGDEYVAYPVQEPPYATYLGYDRPPPRRVPHQPVRQGVSERLPDEPLLFYVTALPPSLPPPRRAVRGGRSVELAFGHHEWEVQGLHASWMTADGRAAVQRPVPVRAHDIAFAPIFFPPAVEFAFWWSQQGPPRNVPRYVTQQVEWYAHPAWLPAVPLIAIGPFYVVAGQISPAAGAIAGDVRAVGED